MSRWRPTARAKARRIAGNAAGVVGIELLAAAQGIDFHAPLTAVDVVSLPVKAVGAGVDAVTTSQAEANQRRGRQIRKEEERLGREARQSERQRAREERRARGDQD
jgi:histidine ammonia-lyase